LWKGIHDVEWVKGGVKIEVRLLQPYAKAKSPIELAVEVTNSAVGHKFPTYVTPKIFVRAQLLNEKGETLPGTQQEKVIGWDARFEDGKWREHFDTRIPPGERSHNIFRWPPHGEAKRITAWVEVHPDHFYHVHFYPAYLKGGDVSPEGRKLIEKALQDSGRSSYTLFSETIALR
jgi:hypothetical protein